MGTTLEKRLDHLEAIAEPPALKPLILYVRGISARQCAERFPDPPDTKGNPLRLIIRTLPAEVQP